MFQIVTLLSLQNTTLRTYLYFYTHGFLSLDAIHIIWNAAFCNVKAIWFVLVLRCMFK